MIHFQPFLKQKFDLRLSFYLYSLSQLSYLIYFVSIMTRRVSLRDKSGVSDDTSQITMASKRKKTK